MNKTASFVVHAEKAGDAKADIKCIGPRKFEIASYYWFCVC